MDGTERSGTAAFKARGAAGGGSRLRRYGELVVGSPRLRDILLYEVLTGLLGPLPGMAGLWLRSRLYSLLFRSLGRGVLIGRNVTLRHPGKISLGDEAIVDDNATLDAKGSGNRGIEVGRSVYIGRNAIVYCKDGDVVLGEKANIGHNSLIFSAGRVLVGAGTLVAAYAYLMSGGDYELAGGRRPLAEQDGRGDAAPTCVGRNCWIGAHAVLVSGVTVGDDSVIGAGAIVTEPVPSGVVAAGVPARIVRHLET